MRRPPRSTLFPTRRSSDLGPLHRPYVGGAWHVLAGVPPGRRGGGGGSPPKPAHPVGRPADRSEEHTSELQSLRHLVCRLLLEKKKNQGVEYHALIRIRHPV